MLRRLWDLADAFPPGRVPLLLLIFALVSGGFVLARHARPRPAGATVWTFTHLAAEEFRTRLADMPAATAGGPPPRVQNLGAAMFDRLTLALMTQKELPDLVEIEQSIVGRFLRGPVEHIPFVDLTDRLRAEGWDQACVPARFARYTIGGRVFGIPHDVHPTVLVYRPDVLAQLGRTPADLATWTGFIAAAREFHRPGAAGTSDWRRGLALSTVECHGFLALLWQRGGDVFDEHGSVVVDNDLAVATLEFYRDLFAGERPAAGPALTGLMEDFAALSRGQFLAITAADWMLAVMQRDGRALLEGKVQCLPLPAWQPGGRRTSTIGGTVLCIPRGNADPERAWALARFLYFDRESLVRRFRTQNIVPPLRTVYDDPVFAEPVAFFQGQQVGLLLTELAIEVPPVHGSPYWPEAYKLLDSVFPAVLEGRRSARDGLAAVAESLRAIIARDAEAVARAQP